MPSKKRTTTRRTGTTRAATRRATSTPSRPPKPQTVTPYLAVPSAAEAIAWYKQAFGAKELSVNKTPTGQIMHAALKIGDSQVFLSDAFPGMDVQPPTTVGGTTVTLHVYSKNLDKLFNQAVDAGAKVAQPLANAFWGDKYGKLTDPFGHSWGFSYPAKLSKEEKARLTEEAMKMMSG